RRFKAVKERTLAFEHGERTERLFKAVDAAKAAAERAQHGPSSLENNITPVIAQPEACLDPVRVRDDLQRFDLIRMLDEPLRQGEAGRKILKIGGRRHHYRGGRAVEDEGDRPLLGQDAGDIPIPLAANGETGHGGGRGSGDRDHRHSAAGATRCARSRCRRYSSCQSLGPLESETCTAVTLYSGQLVAQSEKSV